MALMNFDIEYDRDQLKVLQGEEAILKDNPGRWVVLPIKFPSVWSLFKAHEHDFWTAEDLAYSVSFCVGNIHQAVVNFMAYEAASDHEIYAGLSANTCSLLEQIQIPEARAFYGFECAFNTIQHEGLSMAYRAVVNADMSRGDKEVLAILDKAVEIPSVQVKRTWAARYISGGSDLPFAEKMLCHAIMKSVFNAGRNLLTEILSLHPEYLCVTKALRRSSKTDQLHACFAAECYKLLSNRLTDEAVRAHIRLAVEVERQFCKEMLPLKSADVNEGNNTTVHTYQACR
eukprot:GHVQ01015986.1.p1 GENE.GHVQ01015986.1~~GHVQ01015986.1.p1  ORF type:complete len:287 (-),score=35.18 GHVQ01015986.1:715-1575(-)